MSNIPTTSGARTAQRKLRQQGPADIIVIRPSWLSSMVIINSQPIVIASSASLLRTQEDPYFQRFQHICKSKNSILRRCWPSRGYYLGQAWCNKERVNLAQIIISIFLLQLHLFKRMCRNPILVVIFGKKT